MPNTLRESRGTRAGKSRENRGKVREITWTQRESRGKTAGNCGKHATGAGKSRESRGKVREIVHTSRESRGKIAGTCGKHTWSPNPSFPHFPVIFPRLSRATLYFPAFPRDFTATFPRLSVASLRHASENIGSASAGTLSLQHFCIFPWKPASMASAKPRPRFTQSFESRRGSRHLPCIAPLENTVLTPYVSLAASFQLWRPSGCTHQALKVTATPANSSNGVIASSNPRRPRADVHLIRTVVPHPLRMSPTPRPDLHHSAPLWQPHVRVQGAVVSIYSPCSSSSLLPPCVLPRWSLIVTCSPRQRSRLSRRFLYCFSLPCYPRSPLLCPSPSCQTRSLLVPFHLAEASLFTGYLPPLPPLLLVLFLFAFQVPPVLWATGGPEHRSPNSTNHR